MPGAGWEPGSDSGRRRPSGSEGPRPGGVVDFSACVRGGGFSSCTPTEVAHFSAAGSSFWGVYLAQLPDGQTFILGSDLNVGLWIFQLP